LQKNWVDEADYYQLENFDREEAEKQAREKFEKEMYDYYYGDQDTEDIKLTDAQIQQLKSNYDLFDQYDQDNNEKIEADELKKAKESKG